MFSFYQSGYHLLVCVRVKCWLQMSFFFPLIDLLRYDFKVINLGYSLIDIYRSCSPAIQLSPFDIEP